MGVAWSAALDTELVAPWGSLAAMSSGSEAVIREALTLPSQERAEVATELLASLDGPPFDDEAAVQAAWVDELERRARRALTGADPGEPWSAVRDRVRSTLDR